MNIWRCVQTAAGTACFNLCLQLLHHYEPRSLLQAIIILQKLTEARRFHFAIFLSKLESIYTISNKRFLHFNGVLTT